MFAKYDHNHQSSTHNQKQCINSAFPIKRYFDSNDEYVLFPYIPKYLNPLRKNRYPKNIIYINYKQKNFLKEINKNSNNLEIKFIIKILIKIISLVNKINKEEDKFVAILYFNLFDKTNLQNQYFI